MCPEDGCIVLASDRRNLDIRHAEVMVTLVDWLSAPDCSDGGHEGRRAVGHPAFREFTEAADWQAWIAVR